jgi:hypothetical protein
MATSIMYGSPMLWIGSVARAGALAAILLSPAVSWATEQAASTPQVEIKKLSTGKEAIVRHGEKEWYILIDVDQDRTMIIRSESKQGKEIKSSPEILERPMSNAEVDRVINDFVAGVKSTLKP